MAYNNNENKAAGARKPRKRGAMGLVMATAVAATPAIGCEDRILSTPVVMGSKDAGAATDTGASKDATPGTEAGGMDAIVDAGHDAYSDGVRG